LNTQLLRTASTERASPCLPTVPIWVEQKRPQSPDW
jgi:hypothetical protein